MMHTDDVIARFGLDRRSGIDRRTREDRRDFVAL
jgi:hypothetical protein